MIEGFKVILERLPANRNAMIDDKSRFDRSKCVPLDCGST
jgi:hypothetical protein